MKLAFTLMLQTQINFNNHAKKEAKVLESIIDQKVDSISIHNPSVKGFYPKFPSFNDAYSKKYFKKSIIYLMPDLTLKVKIHLI